MWTHDKIKFIIRSQNRKLERIDYHMDVCDNCNLKFDDFINTGKFGCAKCYETFERKIDPILKNIHGSNRHIGRLGSIKNISNKNVEEEKKDKKESKLDILKQDLKDAIKEERYEDAAVIRDKIKKLEK